MPVKDIKKLLRLEFQFDDVHDAQEYGGGWHLYDEQAIVRKPAGELMRWESEIGAPLADVLNGVRQNSVFGDTCAAFLALKLGGSEVKFDDFQPAIFLTTWRKAEDVDPGKAPTPEPAGAPEPDSPPIVLQHADTSGSLDTPPAG